MASQALPAGKWLQLIYAHLLRCYGEPACSLNYANAYELCVAVVLSAQCTDERVNKVTPVLFAAYPDCKTLSQADQLELEQIIKPLGFGKVKSTNLIKAAQAIESEFNGEIPQSMKGLTQLPGFGRKSANVILGNVFDIPGFPVDTHVKRVLNRLGIVNEKNPDKIEAYINQHLSPAYWTGFSHLLIRHGRECCQARKPACETCPIASHCQKCL